MPTQQDAQNLVLAARFAAANLGEANRILMSNGGMPINKNKINRYQLLIRGLSYLTFTLQDFSSATFLAFFDCLSNLVGISGSPTVDTNYQAPNTNINIIINYPPPIEITTTDMTLGGTRYDNVLWKGFNPFMIVDNTTWLQNGTDYSLISTGGFILNPSGNFPTLYDGQIIRSITYQIA